MHDKYLVTFFSLFIWLPHHSAWLRDWYLPKARPAPCGLRGTITFGVGTSALPGCPDLPASLISAPLPPVHPSETWSHSLLSHFCLGVFSFSSVLKMRNLWWLKYFQLAFAAFAWTLFCSFPSGLCFYEDLIFSFAANTGAGFCNAPLVGRRAPALSRTQLSIFTRNTAHFHRF